MRRGSQQASVSQICSFQVLCVHSPCLVPIQALADCVEDLVGPFESDTVDLVAGIDAMGFILGKETMQSDMRGQSPKEA